MKQAPPASTTDTPHSAAVGTGTMGNKLLVILALLSAVAPLSIDLYLPAFPAMSEDLSTSTSAVQLTLTAFLVGITIGQLIFGPLSDRFGRLRPLLIGAVLCVVASIAAVIAPNVAILVAARLVQGIGGAAGMVIGRAIISDVAHGKAAARAFSLMMIVGGIAPVIAPMVGGFLVDPIGWRGILTVVLGLAVIMLACVVAGIRETFPALRRAELKVLREQSGSPNAALRSREFLSYTLTFGFSFAVMMAYISASPFVYQDMMGLSSMAYGIAFGCNAFALMIVSGIAARLTATHSVRGMLATGVGLMTAGVAAVGILVATGVDPIWLSVPLFVTVASLGLILGNATALALGAVPAAAGSASAVLGALQFGLAAVVSPLVGLGGEDTAAPMAVVMAASALIAVTAFALSRAEGDERATTRMGSGNLVDR
ncbi:Bcr/CflA family efflux MFS transporter [Gordonia amarae]|uniref:Bcr/CflA family efflux MFS transporter n=2 Tax=Gordonia amarae TaxID=36821 RepID=A0A857KYU9_9ACTN|nr:multidrug effflux MFS transporter [Gordonia amarae]MCS3879475.1 DHA1 family bicyclomycin/chloramphenicol resistance-like MFS transporter [Gordonia amarae]QHN17951.1 Bcr/CflA family efflux MFS transporter [Gordonia amarae]QHN22471.1 Bcr/CflA family efflux MFS transporter [Gordonia amarae]QHN31337.1 Bcr/CflA family efflux MFS transporter [Gordonia amarae]QHN40082.1 Bcr/CflA family efflux MFS transporter [Gordonia amarae]